MPTKRSDEPQSVNRRRFLGASVSTAALPFVGRVSKRPSPSRWRSRPATVRFRSLFRSMATLIDLDWTSARPCLTPCGSISGSRDQRRAVITASAGPARCILTACGSFPALRSPSRPKAMRSAPSKGWRVRTDRCIRCSRPSSTRRLPVRLLHAGPDHVGHRLREGGARGRRRYDPRIHERQSVPLRGLSEHRLRRRPSQSADGGLSDARFCL